MADRTRAPGPSDSGSTTTGPGETWPAWVRVLVTLALIGHLTAIVAGAFALPPSSMLQRALADRFIGYFQIFDLGHTYRYYAPEPGPTPVVTANIEYADGRPPETLRLPSRGVLPRLRYQRQLALAYHLTADFRRGRHSHGPDEPNAVRRHVPGEGESLWARSYARHIARTHPGASVVTLYTQDHLIPDPARVAADLVRGQAVDLDAEEFYTAPERIGEFPCDDL